MNAQRFRRHRRSAAVALAVAGIALAACAATPAENSAGNQHLAPVSEAPKIEAVLDEMAAIARMSRTEQRAHLEALEEELATWGDAGTRLQLAWLLSRPGSGFEDSARATRLLEEQSQSPSASNQGLYDLAQIVHKLLIERGKARSAVAQEREAASAKIESLELQVSTLQTLLETMRQQLEALREIETTINERKPPEPELIPDDIESPNPAGG